MATPKTTKPAEPTETASPNKPERILCVTPVGLILYPYLAKIDQGRQYSPNPPKFHTTFCISKDKWEAEGKELRMKVLQVGRDYYSQSKFKAGLQKRGLTAAKLKLSDFANPFTDGDTKDQEMFHGMIKMNPKSKFKPEVRGPDKALWENDRIEKIKSGDFGRLVVSVFSYDQKGGGVTLGLEVLQFASEGEAIGGGRTAQVAMLDEINVDLGDIGGNEENTGDTSDEPTPGDDDTDLEMTADDLAV